MKSINKVIEKVGDIIDSSELVRMAQRHFDEDSTKMMIQELKQDIINEIQNVETV